MLTVVDQGTEQTIGRLVESVSESYAPDMAFMYDIISRHAVELQALIGRSALDHPGVKERLTIAEQYYHEEIDENILSWRDLMEMNRTLMNVWLFRAVLDPDEARGYAALTGAHNYSPVKLSHESYLWLRAFTNFALPDEERKQAMEVALIIADIGKSAALYKDMAQKYQRDYADHDHLLLQVMLDDEMSEKWIPSYYFADPKTKQTILDNFRSGFHMPQVLQQEPPASKWEGFVGLPVQDQMFGLLLGLFDIAGNGGDKVQDRSTTLVEPLLLAFQQQVEAVWAGAESGLNSKDRALFVNDTYLASRARAWNLELDQPYGRQLARLGCAMRFSGAAEMEDLLQAVHEEMLEEDRDNLMELLAYTGYEDEGHVWIMYLPDLIRVYADVLRRLDPSMPRAKAFDAGLTMAARVYSQAKANFVYQDGLIVVTRDMVDAYENQTALAQVKNISVGLRAPGEAWAQFLPMAA